MICFDIETLGIRSSAVVLSVGCVMFSFDDKVNHTPLSMDDRYRRYLATALFVKFKAEEQFKLKRTTDKDAMEWWKKQGQVQRNRSFLVYPDDLDAVDGIKLIGTYCLAEGKNTTIWQRGSLDNIVFDDLCRSVGKEPPMEYYQWMDVRTALNLTKEKVNRGYCDVPGFDTSLVIKHDPVHDAAYDVMQLLYGE